MSQASRAKLRPGKGPRGHYLLRLFIADNGSNSKQAQINLRRICQEHLNGRFTIETVDVAKDFQAAVRNNILVTPALLLVAPRPRVMILGNLGDSQKVLVALRLSGVPPKTPPPPKTLTGTLLDLTKDESGSTNLDRIGEVAERYIGTVARVVVRVGKKVADKLTGRELPNSSRVSEELAPREVRAAKHQGAWK